LSSLYSRLSSRHRKHPLTSVQRDVVGGLILTHRRHSRKTMFCKLLKKKDLANEPISRILCAARLGPRFASRSVRPARRSDHSSRPRITPGLKQPTRGSQRPFFRPDHVRAGPALPSYLALLHAGFSVPRMSPPGRWALTPPFHPCQMRSTERGGPSVLPKACRRGASITGGLFSVALSVAVFPAADLRPRY
jgi:hypothetical protein